MGRAQKLAKDKDRTDAEKIEELYYVAFARSPKKEELQLALDYLAREVENEKGQKTPADKGKSYEDIVWAIFNTKEFLFNL